MRRIFISLLRVTIFVTLFYLCLPLVASAQWKQTNGPYGGSINALTYIGNIAICVSNSGLYHSNDDGQTWVLAAPLRGGFEVSQLVTQGSDLFAASSQNGIFRSSDSGITWNATSTGLPIGFRSHELVSSGSTLFTLSESGGVFYSRNSGEYWSLADSNLMAICRPRTIMTLDSTIYVAGDWITCTTDQGETWRVVGIPPPDGSWHITAMVGFANILLAIEEDHKIIRSDDAGRTWSMQGTAPLTGADSAVITRSLNSVVFVATSHGVYCSVDSGLSWTVGAGFPKSEKPGALCLHGSLALCGFAHLGLYRSLDKGRTWVGVNMGLYLPSPRVLSAVHDSIFVATDYGLFVSPDNGEIWEHQAIFGMSPITAMTIGDSIWEVAGGSEGAATLISRSTNRGRSWTTVSSSRTMGKFRVMTKHGAFVIGGSWKTDSNAAFYYSSDQGITWRAATVFPNWSNIVVYQILSSGTRLLAATNSGIFRSDNNGVAWTLSSKGLLLPADVARWTLGTDGRRLFALGEQQSENRFIYASDDNGQSWSELNETPFVGVNYIANLGPTLFAATENNGVFISLNSGLEWISLNTGLPDTSIRALSLLSDELVVATVSSGIWRRSLNDIVTLSNVHVATTPHFVAYAYPNPAKQRLTVRLNTNSTAATSAIIVDPSGRETARLFSGELSAGEHDFEWDASSSSSGMYECIVTQGTHVQHLPLLHLR